MNRNEEQEYISPEKDTEKEEKTKNNRIQKTKCLSENPTAFTYENFARESPLVKASFETREKASSLEDSHEEERKEQDADEKKILWRYVGVIGGGVALLLFLWGCRKYFQGVYLRK